jgi:MFS family permease
VSQAAVEAPVPAGRLLRNADFLHLWAAQTIAQFGNQVTVIALPLAAVGLGASPFQMGVLGAFQFVPYLAFGLLVGVWADRVRRRPLLTAASFGRAGLLLLVPASALLGLLRLETLFGVALLVGSLALVFDVAYTALLPSLVRREQLVEANSRLNASLATAQIAGPGLSGLLVQLLTAPIAIAGDAFAFLVTGLLVRRIRALEAIDGERRDVWGDLVEGLRAVWGRPVLRAISLSQLSCNIFISANLAVFVVYMVRVEHMTPVLIGAVYAVGSAGGLLGSLLAPRVARRLGAGPTVVAALAVIGLAATATALPAGPPVVATAGLALAMLVWQVASGLFAINAVSLRQAVTPDRLQGRVQASVKSFTWGLSPVGYLLGGAAGQVLNLRLVLVLAGVGLTLSTGWLIASPVPRLRNTSDVRTDD